MPEFDCDFSRLLKEFVSVSKDGYGIFDARDNLVFANYAFLDIFCLTEKSGIGMNFCRMVNHAFEQKRGINIEAENIQDWLAYVATVRRQTPFRIFEVDLIDGRWLLFSEQMLPSGELMVHTKDITRQKVTETKLLKSVSKLHKLALTDELTHLANRRSFVESVESELARCRRSMQRMTMLVIDLDHFKSINDRYGHQGGDEALKHTANLLKQALRQYDIVGRIGGEEFAIFLGATDQETSLEIAERIRQLLESSPLEFNGQQISITASIGLTTQGCDVSFEQLFTEADDALYVAKGNGRNRVEVYRMDSPDGQKQLGQGPG